MRVQLITVLYLAWPAVCRGMSPGCKLFIRPCVSPEICSADLLRNICSSEDGRCETLSSERCNATVHAVLALSPRWREGECTDEDPCSTLQLLASLCHSAGSYREKVKEKLSAGNQQTSRKSRESDPSWSCLRGMKRCVEDEGCNRKLVPLVRSCSEPQCEERRCRSDTGRFFSGLPQDQADMLVFCQCEQADHDCHHVQNILQSSSCPDQHSPENCLQIIHNCSTDHICRKAFEEFLSKCFGPVDAPLSGYSTGELLHLVDLDFFHTGDKDCRRAFVGTMGSALQSPCTCHGLHHENIYRCNVLRQALQNRTHFRLHGTRRYVSSTEPRGSEPRQSRVWWFSDQLGHFVVYAFLVLGMLIVGTIVFHKLRTTHSSSKKNRFPSFPEDATKSLDL